MTTPVAQQGSPQLHHHDQTGGAWRLAPRIMLVVAIIGMVAISFADPPAIKIVTMVALGITAVLVAIGRYGWRLTGVYVIVAFVVANIFENLSISTGFPFGHYHYPGNSLRIINFPVVIGLLYCFLGLICWFTASALLDGVDRRLADRSDPARRINVVALPALAAALMAMYDVGSDSNASTVFQTWVWERGGGVFGVPLVNYLGWWLTTYIFFQIFALILASRQQLPTAKVEGREPLAIGTAAYFLLGASSLLAFLTSSNDMVTDLGGRIWSVSALNETMLTFNIFSTVVIAALAAVKLLRNDIALHHS
jgi:uncharacterized membrane protein